MPTEGQVLLKTRDEIVQSLIDGLLVRVPDAHVGDDGNLILLFNIMSDVDESIFLAIQIVSDDMFIVTSSPAALDLHGQELQEFRQVGTKSTGNLRFSGSGGTGIPANTEAAYDPGGGEDLLYFTTTALATIPNPGVPVAPVVADHGAAGALAAGTYEYAVTFHTAEGETEIGPASNALVIAINHSIDLTGIPLGGPGTISRSLYRRFNGGAWFKNDNAVVVAALNNNVTVAVNDNAAAISVTPPPADSTAERVTVAAQSDDVGVAYNLLANTITQLTSAPDGVTDVVNVAPFTGGSDTELTEDYRQRLLKRIRSAGSGSASDLETWALEVPGVGHATAFKNDNVGVPTPGHATVRISAPDGSIPGAGVIAATQLHLDEMDMANAIVHVATFVADPIDVTADVTTETGFVLADVHDSVDAAIRAYIQQLNVGEAFIVAGVIASIMPTIGVADVVITAPAANAATAATAKKTVGVITVT